VYVITCQMRQSIKALLGLEFSKNQFFFFINRYVKMLNKASKDFCQILTVEKVTYDQIMHKARLSVLSP